MLLCLLWCCLTIFQQRARIKQLQPQVSRLAAQAAQTASIVAAADGTVEAHRQAARSGLSPAQLVEEINRVRMLNAILSDAYQVVQIIDAHGKRRRLRLALN